MMIFCPWLGCVCRCEGEMSVLGVALDSFKADLVTVNISKRNFKSKKLKLFLKILFWALSFGIAHFSDDSLALSTEFLGCWRNELGSETAQLFFYILKCFKGCSTCPATLEGNCGSSCLKWELQGVPCTPKSHIQSSNISIHLPKSAKVRPFRVLQCFSHYFFFLLIKALHSSFIYAF